jgi:hypothetical protein
LGAANHGQDQECRRELERAVAIPKQPSLKVVTTSKTLSFALEAPARTNARKQLARRGYET